MGTIDRRHHLTIGSWAPPSRPGRWSITLAGLAVAGTAALAVAFALGLEPADGFTDNWALTITGLALLAAGTGAVASGAVAVARDHDRSAGVLAGLVLGALVTLLFLQQVAEGLGWLEA